MSQHAEYIRGKGVNIAVVLYDSERQLDRFSRKYNIPYTLLSDRDSTVIKQYGLLNTTMDEDSPFFGIPWPGIFLTDGQGAVVGKFAEENYRDRPLIEDIVKAVDLLGETTPPQ